MHAGSSQWKSKIHILNGVSSLYQRVHFYNNCLIRKLIVRTIVRTIIRGSYYHAAGCASIIWNVGFLRQSSSQPTRPRIIFPFIFATTLPSARNDAQHRLSHEV